VRPCAHPPTSSCDGLHTTLTSLPPSNHKRALAAHACVRAGTMVELTLEGLRGNATYQALSSACGGLQVPQVGGWAGLGG